MANKSELLCSVGFLLVVASISVGASGEPNQDEKIRSNFIKLSDYLSAKLPNNDEPEANMKLIRQYCNQKNCIVKKLFGSSQDLSIAVDLLKTIANPAQCDSTLFEALSSIVDTTQALNPEKAQRADKLLRIYAIEAVKRCDSFHEEALREALSVMAPGGDITKVENVISDQFIEGYEANRESFMPDGLTFSHYSVTLGLRTHPLTRSLWTVAKDDPKNRLSLRSSPKESGKRRVDRDSVKYLFETYLLAPCKSYYEAVNPVLEFGRVSSKFLENGELEFLNRRSKDYQNALFRRHLCHRISYGSYNIAHAIADFELDL